MRHPLRNLAGQGFWYTLGNVLIKLGGLVLLPLYSNTAYLSVAGFGRWGVFEITSQIAVAILGLQLAAGLIRFYPETERSESVVVTVWWLTVGSALAAGGIAAGLTVFLVPPPNTVLYLWLVAYIVAEMLLAVPLSLLRARGMAFQYTLLAISKLALLIFLNLLFLVYFRHGLLGLLEAFTLSSGGTLLAGLILTGPRRYFHLVFNQSLMEPLLRFSVPLVIAGVGSMVLNAGDRYVLKIFRSNEDLALYTMASKFGGVVNMFGAQPLMLAFLPILFRLAGEQRVEVLRLLMRYLIVGFGILVIGLSLFTGPVLHLLNADPFYQQSVALVPWIALGFAAFGLSIPFEGVLTIFHRTGTVSMWIVFAALLNLALNFVMVPFFGPTGAAISTTIAYGGLFAGRYYSSRNLLHVPYAWGSIFGLTLITIMVAFAGILIPFPENLSGWFLRSGLLVLWAVIILLARWISLDELREVWTVFRRKKSEPVDAQNVEGS